ncbi:TetR/AcrR family transcriptional regulator [Marinobacterium sediminicola]|uniref:Transcriptional regulator, TetR family n=1 Tax=Marinobacterium sediminicola TaxID=518898 RepID=A0ABY1RVX9_9GAMM|nr:TetR/AcrR family transcriptional regulator [Marinobacterium sediminicola]ULG70514.1 TetR/AcrR family transcriptional regulator [Marinobacterium sediminicola]SMR69123.1 transcriptional regulator, TetR family [Marinobacterium sediminicola]
MARRNDHTREELHELALSAAEEILQTRGVQALSTRKVAAAIGYSAGSLYSVFSNLDDLCWQLNSRTLNELMAALKAVKVASPKTSLYAYADTYLAFAARYPERWRLLFEHRSSDSNRLPAELALRIESLFELIEKALSDLFQDSAEVIAVRARVLWSGVHGIAQLRSGDKLFLHQADAERKMLDALIEGLLSGWSLEAERDA